MSKEKTSFKKVGQSTAKDKANTVEGQSTDKDKANTDQVSKLQFSHAILLMGSLIITCS